MPKYELYDPRYPNGKPSTEQRKQAWDDVAKQVNYNKYLSKVGLSTKHSFLDNLDKYPEYRYFILWNTTEGKQIYSAAFNLQELTRKVATLQKEGSTPLVIMDMKRDFNAQWFPNTPVTPHRWDDLLKNPVITVNLNTKQLTPATRAIGKLPMRFGVPSYILGIAS